MASVSSLAEIILDHFNVDTSKLSGSDLNVLEFIGDRYLNAEVAECLLRIVGIRSAPRMMGHAVSNTNYAAAFERMNKSQVSAPPGARADALEIAAGYIYFNGDRNILRSIADEVVEALTIPVEHEKDDEFNETMAQRKLDARTSVVKENYKGMLFEATVYSRTDYYTKFTPIEGGLQRCEVVMTTGGRHYMAMGVASSKKDAEQLACKDLLKSL
jgi:dsRNA-specific ribonuclease